MIQELMDCGPSRTYPVYYLEDAMNHLGDCFDYAVNDYGAEGTEVGELFCLSGVARESERGNAWVVSGKSGVELFALIAERSGYQAGSMPDRSYRFEKTPEYWTGWILAYLQWRLGEPFENLPHVVPFDVLCGLYYPLARSLGGTRGASCMRYGEENTSSNQVGAGKKEDQENPTRPGIRIGRITPLNPDVRTAPEKHQRSLGNNRKGYGKSPTLQHRRPPRASLRIQRNQRCVKRAYCQGPLQESAPCQQKPPPIKAA